MLLCYFALRWLPLALGCGTLIFLAGTKRSVPFSWKATLVLSSVLATSVCALTLTQERRNYRFLKAMVHHVTETIGARAIQDAGYALRDRVNSGGPVNARLGAKDYPKGFAMLFPKTPIEGFIVYGPGDKCRQVVICWGGNFFRWGIEIPTSDNGAGTPLEKGAELPLTDAIACFIEK